MSEFSLFLWIMIIMYLDLSISLHFAIYLTFSVLFIPFGIDRLKKIFKWKIIVSKDGGNNSSYLMHSIQSGLASPLQEWRFSQPLKLGQPRDHFDQ